MKLDFPKSPAQCLQTHGTATLMQAELIHIFLFVFVPNPLGDSAGSKTQATPAVPADGSRLLRRALGLLTPNERQAGLQPPELRETTPKRDKINQKAPKRVRRPPPLRRAGGEAAPEAAPPGPAAGAEPPPAPSPAARAGSAAPQLSPAGRCRLRGSRPGSGGLRGGVSGRVAPLLGRAGLGVSCLSHRELERRRETPFLPLQLLLLLLVPPPPSFFPPRPSGSASP